MNTNTSKVFTIHIDKIHNGFLVHGHVWNSIVGESECYNIPKVFYATEPEADEAVKRIVDGSKYIQPKPSKSAKKK